MEAIITPRPGTGSTNTDVGGQDGPGGGHQTVPGCLLLREEEVICGAQRGVRADEGAPDYDRLARGRGGRNAVSLGLARRRRP